MRSGTLFSGVLWVALAAAGPARGMTIEGVALKREVAVEGKTLVLNGAGLRIFNLGPVPVRVYVASFHAPSALRSSEAVLESDGPLQFEFTFLRGFSEAQVRDAWNAQFKASVGHRYAGLAGDLETFVGAFGALKKGGRQTVKLVGSDTQVYEDGTLKATVRGRDFQKAFLSLWFGATPVTPGLKEALLGAD